MKFGDGLRELIAKYQFFIFGKQNISICPIRSAL